MSEVIKEPVAQPVVNSVPPVVDDVTPNNTLKYKEDMFRYKQEARDLKAQLAEIELAKEQKKGNFEGVIGTLKDKNAESLKEIASLKKTFAENVLDKAIENTAISRGLKGTQLEAFMKLIDHDAKGVVEFDERFNAKSEDVVTLVDDHMKRYGDIFNTKVNVIDHSPNNNPINRPTKTFDEKKATASETIDYLLANKDKLK